MRGMPGKGWTPLSLLVTLSTKNLRSEGMRGRSPGSFLCGQAQGIASGLMFLVPLIPGAQANAEALPAVRELVDTGRMSCRADWACGAWVSPDRATSVQPDERRSPAGPTPKASCESGRGRAGCSIHSGGVSSSLGAVRELKSGRELGKDSTLDGTVGSRPRPSLPAPGPGPPRVLHPTFPRGRQADPLGVLQGVGCFEARWGRFLGTAGVYLVRSVSPGARAAVVQVGLLTGRLTQVLSSAGVVHR